MENKKNIKEDTKCFSMISVFIAILVYFIIVFIGLLLNVE